MKLHPLASFFLGPPTDSTNDAYIYYYVECTMCRWCTQSAE